LFNGFNQIETKTDSNFKRALKYAANDSIVTTKMISNFTPSVTDMADLQTNAHLFRYDSTYGIFPGQIETGDVNPGIRPIR
jgi:glyceraldehyde-3-phosphate dehydrogenase/erythrose-4-phosphate dehydrogenase